MKFTTKENIQLTEIYRRLGYFKQWKLDESLLLLSVPSHVKSLKEKGIIKPYRKETPRVYNWYHLTNKGQGLFKSFIPKEKLTEDENLDIFEGRKTFDFSLTTK